MDVNESSKRESVGSGLEYNFDQELCFEPLDFGSLGLTPYPELPAGKKDLNNIAQVSKSIFREKKDQVRTILDKIYK